MQVKRCDVTQGALVVREHLPCRGLVTAEFRQGQVRYAGRAGMKKIAVQANALGKCGARVGGQSMVSVCLHTSALYPVLCYAPTLGAD